MKPNFPLSSEVILTLIAIFLLGIGILVSIVFLAFMFSGNASEFTLPHLPTKLVPTRKYATPSQGNATKSPTSLPPTDVVSPKESSISSPTAINIFPTVDLGETSVEVTFSDNPLTISGTSIRIEILINNYGPSSITLSESNLSFSGSDGTPLALQSSEPDLPEEIQPDTTKTFQFVFPRPTPQTCTLKILGMQYEVDVE